MSLLRRSIQFTVSVRDGAPRTAIAVALCWAESVLALAPAAWAGHYHLYSCTDPVTQAPLPSDGWGETPGINVRTENTCSAGNALSAAVR